MIAEQLGVLAVLAGISTVVAEQLFGPLLQKRWMALAALGTSIAVTYAARYVGGTVGEVFGFATMPALGFSLLWAYGIFVFVAAHYVHEGLKLVAPNIATPSIRVGDLVAGVVEKVTNGSGNKLETYDVLPTDKVIPGDYLWEKETKNVVKVFAALDTGLLRVEVLGAVLDREREHFQWINAPRRV